MTFKYCFCLHRLTGVSTRLNNSMLFPLMLSAIVYMRRFASSNRHCTNYRGHGDSHHLTETTGFIVCLPFMYPTGEEGIWSLFSITLTVKWYPQRRVSAERVKITAVTMLSVLRRHCLRDRVVLFLLSTLGNVLFRGRHLERNLGFRKKCKLCDMLTNTFLKLPTAPVYFCPGHFTVHFTRLSIRGILSLRSLLYTWQS